MSAILLGGKHQAQRDERNMFPEAVRAVRELMPKAFIFENVKGLMRESFTSYFSYIHLQLQYPELSRCKGENLGTASVPTGTASLIEQERSNI